MSSILAAVFAIMVVQGVSFTDPSIIELLNWGANFAPFIEKGEWWRLFSASAIHFGVFHLAVNIFSLFVLGREFERRYGSKLFVVLYISGILISGIGSFYWNLFTVSTGASGAIMAIAGAQLAGLIFVSDYDQQSRIKAFTQLFLAILINIGLGLYLPFIDNAAHISGILWGVIFGLIVFPGNINSKLIHAARLLSILLLTTSIFFIFIYKNQPYRYWYYTMFNSFISNDAQTVELLNSNAGPDNPLVSMAGVNEATDVWNKNMEMLLLFSEPPKQLSQDIAILKRIFELRNNSLLQMKKYVASGDLVYIDSIQIQNETIKNLPPLKYWLVFDQQSQKSDDHADTIRTKPGTLWYDSNWKETVKEKASFYRNGHYDELGNTHGIVKDYYLSGQLQMKGTYVKNLEDGLFFYYNSDGSYSAYGKYVYGSKAGDWFYFDDQGNKISEITYTERGEVINNSWSHVGIQGVIEEEGHGKAFIRVVLCWRKVLFQKD
ncbi:MAG: rhomboid family intramembrane serine protease [Bacteroidetes bacterium]|nr:rhomboid family intramembrane serine protease [Bacteroidota bacterium]